jgi:superfamily II DNA or RNA helicase
MIEKLIGRPLRSYFLFQKKNQSIFIAFFALLIKITMIININGIKIYFPYKYIYPEQYEYIKEVINSLSTPGHILIEMPSGTGKTVALLSVIKCM